MNQMSSVNSMLGASALNGLDDPSQQQLQPKPPKPPGTFRRILGGIAGAAGNIFAPGIGGALSNIIGGGSNTALLGNLELYNMQRQEQQAIEFQNQLYKVQERMQMTSAVLQAKHQTSMAVINNLKS